MGRHEQREQIFMLLFRVEFYGIEERNEQITLFFQDEERLNISEKDVVYITEKYHKIEQLLPELDKKIDEKAEGWKVDRMGKVELTVLRLALYEILKDKEVPNSVAINEAVEIAKKYGQQTSGGFVNAVLAKFV